MAVQDSTFNTTHVLDNEIIKANDFEFAFKNLIENVAKSTQMMLESTQDFVINGKVSPSSGMKVQVAPIYGVCKSTGIPFGRTDTHEVEYSFEGSSSGRIDILEVQGDWETYDNQQRAFNDPDTDTQTYQYVDTKQLMRPFYQIKKGVEGSGIAPTVDSGYVKIAEVSVRAGASSILATDIMNITADVAGMENTDWTADKDVTYNIGYISDVNARFRVQHNEDGTHADDCINQDSLDIGTGAKQINGNILPIGGAITIPSQAAISATDGILSVITKAVNVITTLYNNYLKFGTYGFEGEVQISATDTSGVLNNPLKLSADGSGNAAVKIGNTTVLSIDTNGKIHTSYNSLLNTDDGYTVVTKAITDSINTAVSNLNTRVTNIENTSDTTVYANGTLSAGTGGRYNIDSTSIVVATTQNVTLNGNQNPIDGVNLNSGEYLLVKDQTDAKENGIYQYLDNALWQRVNDFQTPNSLKAKLFSIQKGTTNGKKMFYLPKVNFVDGSDFGSDDILFSEYFGAVLPAPDRMVMRDSSGHVKTATSAVNNDAISRGEFSSSDGAMAKMVFNYVWPVGSVYTQYPGQLAPNDPLLYGNFSTWEELDYAGSFFRAAGGNAEAFEATKTVSGVSGTTININAHGLNVGSVLYDKENNEARYVVSVTDVNNVVVNAAFSSSNLTNVLIGQYDQIQNITGYIHATQGYGIFGNGVGAFYVSGSAPVGLGGGDWGAYDAHFDASRVARTGTETHPTNLTMKIWKRTN